MNAEERSLAESRGTWRSLRAKFFSSGVVVLTTIFFTLMLFLPFMNLELDEQIKQMERDQHANVRKEAETIARLLVFEFSRLQDLIEILYPLSGGGLEAAKIPIRNYLWEKVTFNAIIRNIRLLNDTGEILLTPFGTAETPAEPPAPDIREHLAITGPVFIGGPDVEHVFMPLYIEGNRWGVVQIEISTAEVRRQIDAQIARQGGFRNLLSLLFFGALVLSSLVGIVILNLLAERITGPLKVLARNAEIFAASGDPGALEEIRAENDEVGMLARNFTRMAAEVNRLLREKDEAYSQLKSSQEQLRQSEKLATLGQLSGGVAHEINNALSPIRLRAEEILMTIEEGGTAQPEDLQVILKGIEQCSTIVRKLRNFAAPSLGGRGAVDLNQVLAETVALVRRQIEKAGVRIALDFGTIPSVSASAGELEQVFMNMLLNSRDAIETTGRSSGVISIRTSGGEGAVTVEIADDGCGMDEATAARMFEPFFTTKGVGKGTGLGMSVSFGILQSHGAAIEVRSAPGAGTTLFIRFPLPPLALEKEPHDDA